MNRNQKLAVVSVLALALSLGAFACSTLEGNAYKTLGTASVAVDTSMKVYADLVVAGKVSAATQVQVKQAFADYQLAMTAAQTAISIWKASGGVSATFPSVQVAAATSAAGNVQTKVVTP